MDGRKNNKGTKGNKGGRPRKIPITGIIERYCEKFIIELLDNADIKDQCNIEIGNNVELIKGNSFLYIIKSNGFFKIGITSNIKNRFKNYSSHSGYSAELIFCKKMYNANDIEKELINMYSLYSIQGDWFDLSDSILIEIISFISQKEL